MSKKRRGAYPFLKFSDAENFQVFNYFKMRLLKIAISRYEWKGLPNTCNPIYLERMLALNGFCIFFKDETSDMFANLGGTASNYDKYGDPLDFVAVGANGVYQNADLNISNSVIIYNNTLKTSEIPQITYHATNLTLLARQMQVNIWNQKTPVIMRGNETNALSYINFYEKMERNEPYIIIKEDFDTKGINCVDVRPPYITDKLRLEMDKEWGEALADLGIFYSPIAKRERQTSAESMGNYQAVLAIRSEGELSRKYALDKIKNLFPELKNVTVRFNGKVEEDMHVLGEVIENGSIHDNNTDDMRESVISD